MFSYNLRHRLVKRIDRQQIAADAAGIFRRNRPFVRNNKVSELVHQRQMVRLRQYEPEQFPVRLVIDIFHIHTRDEIGVPIEIGGSSGITMAYEHFLHGSLFRTETVTILNILSALSAGLLNYQHQPE
jgi:hypothetical protein